MIRPGAVLADLILRAIERLQDRGELPCDSDEVAVEISRMADEGIPEAIAAMARWGDE